MKGAKEIYQQKVWESIARPWKEFKVSPLEEVSDFLKDKEGNVLDLCCGTGRNFLKTKGSLYAVDYSSTQIKYAKQYAKNTNIKVNIKRAEATNLPFSNDFFEYAFFISSLHCMETSKKRKKALQELYRVLKPEGEAIVTVWKDPKDKPKEGYLPWVTEKETYRRYYYMYDKKELADLLGSVGFNVLGIKYKKTSNSFYSKNDTIALIKKP